MDGQINNTTPPPPPPLPTGQRTPPPKENDRSSPKNSLRRSPAGGGRMPPRSRPQVVRRDSSGVDSSGSGFGLNRSGGRGYEFGDLTKELSFKVKEGVETFNGKPEWELGEGYQVPSSSAQPKNIDQTLILASLDKEAVEDEAENTLLEVLERRQVSFANQTVAPPTAHSARHRRHRSRITSEIPNIGLIQLRGDAPRPSSAPSSSEAMSRPGLNDVRSISHGGSKRNLLQKTMGNSARNVTADWAFDSEGGLLQTFSESPDDEHDGGAPGEHKGEASSKSATNHNGGGYERENRPRLSSLPNNSYQQRHQRVRSGMPGFQRGISDSSQSSSLISGLTTPGERARHVALTMKTLAASNNVQEASNPTFGPNSDLPDLMNAISAQRDNDEASNGSQHKSSGSRSGLPNRSSKGSRASGPLSSENKSRGSSAFSGGPHRPFSGVSSSLFSSNDGFMSNVDKLFNVAERVQELCQIEEEAEGEDDVSVKEQNANFLSQVAASHPEIPTVYSEDENTDESPILDADSGGVDEQTPMLKQNGRKLSTVAPRRAANFFSSITKVNQDSRWSFYYYYVRNRLKMLAVALDPPYVKERLWDFCQNELAMVIVPAIAISAFIYYRMNNPLLFKTDASTSWWILFAIRHYLTLQGSYMVEYLFVDVMALRSLVSVDLIGPLATLYTINAKGWPFILTTWGVLNFLLIQENHDTGHSFFSHWLYFLDIDMFNNNNDAGNVVDSELYREILVSMIIAGVATSVKRTILALYLGKRVYVHYKPRLEKVMEQMILITEVADLGNAVDNFEFEKVDNPNEEAKLSKNISSRTSQLQDTIRASTMISVVKKQGTRAADTDSGDDEAEGVSKGDRTDESTPWNRLRTASASFDEIEDPTVDLTEDITEKIPSQESLKNLVPKESPSENVHERISTEAYILQEEEMATEDMPTEGPPISTVQEPVSGLLHNASTTFRIKSLLDEWEEPVNKADKLADPTIHEILQFRKALTFLDDTHPFGSSYGPATTREENIKSAKSLYRRLLDLEPGSPTAHFDIFGVLAYSIDGTFDQQKAKSLVRLFRPSKFDDVTLLHFIQSCDSVYKRIRYLRASVGNATLIDSVLENIFNCVFGFVLALTIMSVLQLNPWTLLVSMSTILVSFAFALGPSAAKLIEGMIMIAFRRPFDLGDRISIVDCTGAPDNSDDPGYHDTWIVEDCNLFTTTLRLSRTNEVSTINNGSISNTRIVNHGRSMHALVNIHLAMRIDVTHEQVQIVKSALQQYVRDSPRIWSSIINFRISQVDIPNDRIVYSARIQHVKSWQDLLPILQAKGDLEKFCAEILTRLDIHFDHYYSTSNIYVKEFPDQGDITGHDSPFPEDAVSEQVAA